MLICYQKFSNLKETKEKLKKEKKDLEKLKENLAKKKEELSSELNKLKYQGQDEISRKEIEDVCNNNLCDLIIIFRTKILILTMRSR